MTKNVKLTCNCLVAFVSFFYSIFTWASCLESRLTGVNLSGAEFNSKELPGRAFVDYTYPKEEELSFIAAQGANIIRLPFRWERIQHSPYQKLDKQELRLIEKTVNLANDYGLCVLLDVHNYAKYYDEPIGSNNVKSAAFIDLWKKLAAEFDDPNKTIFGLMNEPFYISITDWTTLSQKVITALRNDESKNYIMVAGGRWSGVHDWFIDREDGASNATALATLTDPLQRIYIEAHQYADYDYSGTTLLCKNANEFHDMFENLTSWGEKNNFKLFLGEFGMADFPHCLAVLKKFMQLTNNNQWLGWTYWASGAWWGSYPFLLNTNSAKPSTKWKILKPYLAGNGTKSAPSKVKDVEVYKGL